MLGVHADMRAGINAGRGGYQERAHMPTPGLAAVWCTVRGDASHETQSLRVWAPVLSVRVCCVRMGECAGCWWPRAWLGVRHAMSVWGIAAGFEALEPGGL